MGEPARPGVPSSPAGEGESILARVIAETHMDAEQMAREEVHAQIAALAQEIENGTVEVPSDLEAVIGARMADIDALLGEQVNEIIHDEAFQRLEASWRGLHYLVSTCATDEMLKIRVLNASRKDLLNDLERAPEFDQSALFVKVYEEEYGILGGEPFGALVGDYEFTNHPQDVALLERLSNVAAAAHAPFMAGAAPGMFGMDSFAELDRPRDLAKMFSSPEYIMWRRFRESEDSRYVALTLPRILLREPYGPETVPVASFNFAEDVSGTDCRKYLFGGAAHALAGRIAEAFAIYRWCGAIRGVDGGGLVEDLPSPSFETDRPGLVVRGPTETDLTDLREKELADLGFVPIVHCKGSADAVFYSTQSCQKPKRYDTEEANVNARLSTQLQYMLSTSRFAHYLKVMMRDKTGSNMTANECEDHLNRWITDYCLGNPESAGSEEKARRPLSDARVTVREVRGKPGHYEAVVHLLPHFQLDELTVSLRLVTELPSAAQAT